MSADTLDAKDRARLESLAAARARRGAAMFFLDLAAAAATDHVREDARFTNHPAGVGGWFVDAGANGYETTFFSADMPARRVCSVTFSADGRPLSDFAVAGEDVLDHRHACMARTALLARSAIDPEAGQIFNTIVIPIDQGAPAETPIDAYLIHSAQRPGDIVVGQHWFVQISPDAQSLLGAAPLSRSNLILPGDGTAPPRDITITHLIDDTPSETHTFLSMLHRVQIDVIATPSNTHWQVDGETTQLLGTLQR